MCIRDRFPVRGGALNTIQQTTQYAKPLPDAVDSSMIYPNNFELDYDAREIFLPVNDLRLKTCRD